MTYYANYPLGADVCKYEPKVDYSILKEGEVEYVVARAGKGNYYVDPYLQYHYNGARQQSIPFGVYWVFDPLVSGQSSYCSTILSRYAVDPEFIAIDLEISRDQYGNIIPSSTQYNSFVTTYNEFLRLGKPIVIYTRRTFVTDYVPDLVKWIDANKPKLWLAYYPFGTSAVATTWENVRNLIDPSRVNNTYLKIGNVTASCWQFNDKFILPGVTDDLNKPTAIDTNISSVSKWWTDEVDPEPPPSLTLESLDERVKTLEDMHGIGG